MQLMELNIPLVLALNAVACFLTYAPLSDNTALRLVISNTYFVFFMLLLHRGNLLRKLLAVLGIFLTMVLTELPLFFWRQWPPYRSRTEIFVTWN